MTFPNRNTISLCGRYLGNLKFKIALLRFIEGKFSAALAPGYLSLATDYKNKESVAH